MKTVASWAIWPKGYNSKIIEAEGQATKISVKVAEEQQLKILQNVMDQTQSALINFSFLQFLPLNITIAMLLQGKFM